MCLVHATNDDPVKANSITLRIDASPSDPTRSCLTSQSTTRAATWPKKDANIQKSELPCINNGPMNVFCTVWYVSTIKIYHSKQPRFLCFGPFSIQDSPHRFILRFHAISLQCVTKKFDLVESNFAFTGSKTQISFCHSFRKSRKISICFDQFSV